MKSYHLFDNYIAIALQEAELPATAINWDMDGKGNVAQVSFEGKLFSAQADNLAAAFFANDRDVVDAIFSATSKGAEFSIVWKGATIGVRAKKSMVLNAAEERAVQAFADKLLGYAKAQHKRIEEEVTEMYAGGLDEVQYGSYSAARAAASNVRATFARHAEKTQTA